MVIFESAGDGKYIKILENGAVVRTLPIQSVIFTKGNYVEFYWGNERPLSRYPYYKIDTGEAASNANEVADQLSHLFSV